MIPSQAPTLDHLLSTLQSLTEPQLAILSRMATAMQKPVAGTHKPDSDIVTPAFFTAFGNELLLYHAVHENKLSKKTFEHLFMYAALAAGRKAYINKNSTAAEGDVKLDREWLSMKTQADKQIRSGKIYIQKLMEARWIRNYEDKAEIVRQASSRIPEHVRRYERVIMLRAFETPANHLTYELVEIPRELFIRLENIGVEAYSDRNKYGSTSVEVRGEGGELLYRMLLDGSVEKIRIFGLLKSVCIVHGEWIVPVPVAAIRDDDDDEE